jgi:hypothetical protein
MGFLFLTTRFRNSGFIFRFRENIIHFSYCLSESSLQKFCKTTKSTNSLDLNLACTRYVTNSLTWRKAAHRLKTHSHSTKSLGRTQEIIHLFLWLCTQMIQRLFHHEACLICLILIMFTCLRNYL